MRHRCLVYQCDRPVPYLQAWRWQQQLVKLRQQEQIEDVLIILEHPSVYTLGQGSSWEFVKFDPQRSDIEWHQIERGGEVTYHALGQLVAYPILNLKNHQQDLHWYLRQLEAVIIRVLGSYGINGERITGLTGVWVDGKKIAQVGIKVSKWVTMHGLSLNVNMDMTGFGQIVPCGISDRQVCQLQEFIPTINLETVTQRLIDAFTEVFALDVVMTPIPFQLFCDTTEYR
ncbi:lipoate-protein ligase B [Synechococcus sp. PCC 7502]|uniref:lipoyl(octanoyl) transferase LipB n=1 Tax=Synechococcus sp. PCC 7502 TaxID=1173263 RepID=UPI00029FFF59|nr:lipoyl(octanoyl) transferase LipB [Synechococcus sp. PCC 7502]AFY72689.1 lipoate-protein ligase B [Synechococcus sp. PCC 7502]